MAAPTPPACRPPHSGRRRSRWIGGSLAAIVGIASCGPRLPALGPSTELSLSCRFDPDDGRIEALRSLLGREGFPRSGEPAFRLVRIGPQRRPDGRNVLLLVDLSEEADRRRIARILSEEDVRRMAGRAADHLLLRDVWAPGQVVLLVHARDEGALRAHLGEEGGRLYSDLHGQAIAALRDALYAGGERGGLLEEIRLRHRFVIRVPAGYSVAHHASGVQIHRLVADEPKRWLLAGESAGPAPAGLDGWMERRDVLVGRLRPGDACLEGRTTLRESEFQGSPCVVLEGIWQNERYAMGGIFRMYGFARDNRLFLLDLAVYHPPGPKLGALRQLMAIASTFEAETG